MIEFNISELVTAETREWTGFRFLSPVRIMERCRSCVFSYHHDAIFLYLSRFIQHRSVVLSVLQLPTARSKHSSGSGSHFTEVLMAP